MNADGSTQTSTLPLGVASHPGKAVSTFFYAVGGPLGADGTPANVDRVGFLRLPRAHFKARHEREDKDNHDDGSKSLLKPEFVCFLLGNRPKAGDPLQFSWKTH